MVLPRFTIRTLLVMLTICAVASVIIGTAFRGQTWAWGVTIGLASLVVTAVVHGAWFGVAWLFAQLPSSRAARASAALGRGQDAANHPNESAVG
jgi:hypothetical protein